MYLAWLIHMVGDVHQPLHCVALFNDPYAEKGDRGGNDFYVKPNQSPVNLHRLWNGALGRKKDPIKINNQALQIQKQDTISKGQKQKANALFDFDPEAWSKEGHRNAIEYVYLNGTLEGSNQKEIAPPLPKDYGKNMKILAEKLIKQSGNRLAQTINAM